MSEKKSFFDEPPSISGNIWGWKFSMISLVIILLVAALAYFRWVQLGKPSLREAPPTEHPTTPPPHHPNNPTTQQPNNPTTQ